MFDRSTDRSSHGKPAWKDYPLPLLLSLHSTSYHHHRRVLITHSPNQLKESLIVLLSPFICFCRHSQQQPKATTTTTPGTANESINKPLISSIEVRIHPTIVHRRRCRGLRETSAFLENLRNLSKSEARLSNILLRRLTHLNRFDWSSHRLTRLS